GAGRGRGPSPKRLRFRCKESSIAILNPRMRCSPARVPNQSTLSRRSERPMKRLIRQTTIAVTGLLTPLLFSAMPRSALAGPPFPDKNLEAAIREVLKHEPKVELTDEKLLDIYFLEAPGKAGKEIKDLTGLEKCKNLALIKLTKNKISDLKPLKDLAN